MTGDRVARGLNETDTATIVRRRQKRRALQSNVDRINGLGINGWWEGCNFDAPNVNSCSGSFEPTGVFQLDTSGRTCYVHPNDPTYPAVHFFATNPDLRGSDYEREVFIYTIFFNRNERARFAPRDCNYAGVCSCGTIEALRPGFPQTFGWCRNSRCRLRATFPFSEEKACNVNAKYEYFDSSINATTQVCVLTASLSRAEGLTKRPSASPSFSPTQSPSMPPSGACAALHPTLLSVLFYICSAVVLLCM